MTRPFNAFSYPQAAFELGGHEAYSLGRSADDSARLSECLLDGAVVQWCLRAVVRKRALLQPVRNYHGGHGLARTAERGWCMRG